MKHPKSMIAAAFILLLAGLDALATPQDEGHRYGSSPTPNYPSFTDHFKCTVTKVLPGQVLMVKEEDTRSFRFLELTPAVSLKAKKRAGFGGRKKLEFEDPAAGQRLKVTYLLKTGEIVKVQVLDRESGPH